MQNKHLALFPVSAADGGVLLAVCMAPLQCQTRPGTFLARLLSSSSRSMVIETRFALPAILELPPCGSQSTEQRGCKYLGSRRWTWDQSFFILPMLMIEDQGHIVCIPSLKSAIL